MLVEAAAEVAFDSRAVLPSINVPVLLIAGDEDLCLPSDIVKETARLIPECTLRLYEGTGHLGAVGDKRLIGDVLAFANRAQPDATGQPLA